MNNLLEELGDLLEETAESIRAAKPQPVPVRGRRPKKGEAEERGTVLLPMVDEIARVASADPRLDPIRSAFANIIDGVQTSENMRSGVCKIRDELYAEFARYLSTSNAERYAGSLSRAARKLKRPLKDARRIASKFGKMGARAAKRARRDDPDNAKKRGIVDEVVRRINDPKNTQSDNAIFDQVSRKHLDKKSGKPIMSKAALKKAYQRRAKESRGKYEREGKPRGPYSPRH